MYRFLSFLAGITLLTATSMAQERTIVANAKPDAAATHFDTVIRQALDALAKAGSYSVLVESKWGVSDDRNDTPAGGRYTLISQGNRYRLDIQSLTAHSPDLICVNDGAQVTTCYPARKLYSQHAADSVQSTLQANKMLALSLQGSALDILLQRDVVNFVHAQATGLVEHGETILNGKKVQHFELLWGGAKVELFFAAEGDPLLLQFIHTTRVHVGANEKHEMICTARFQWTLGRIPPGTTFALSLTPEFQRVDEIYGALSGEAASMQIGKPLPKLQLSQLDATDVALAADASKKATVLIFWATWCAASVEDLPELHKFVTAYKDRGVMFYAVNVGQQPGEVRRFTAKHPLVSTVLLDPRATASSALRINDLPAVAVVAPDNNVRAILHGTAKELQGELAAHLEELLSGRASSTARRPGDSAGRAK